MITSLRFGFATNSSSSHSVVVSQKQRWASRQDLVDAYNAEEGADQFYFGEPWEDWGYDGHKEVVELYQANPKRFYTGDRDTRVASIVNFVLVNRALCPKLSTPSGSYRDALLAHSWQYLETVALLLKVPERVWKEGYVEHDHGTNLYSLEDNEYIGYFCSSDTEEEFWNTILATHYITAEHSN